MAAIALAVTGCGGESSRVNLPSQSGVPAAPATPSASEEMAKAAYTGFWPANDRALSGPPEKIRVTLRDYSTGSYLDFQVREMVLRQSRHQGPWGNVTPHITKVEVAGETATLHDCQDAANAGLADTRSGELIPGTRGTKNRNLVARLARGSDGRWRVRELKQFRRPCRSTVDRP